MSIVTKEEKQTYKGCKILKVLESHPRWSVWRTECIGYYFIDKEGVKHIDVLRQKYFDTIKETKQAINTYLEEGQSK